MPFKNVKALKKRRLRQKFKKDKDIEELVVDENGIITDVIYLIARIPHYPNPVR